MEAITPTPPGRADIERMQADPLRGQQIADDLIMSGQATKVEHLENILIGFVVQVSLAAAIAVTGGRFEADKVAAVQPGILRRYADRVAQIVDMSALSKAEPANIRPL